MQLVQSSPFSLSLSADGRCAFAGQPDCTLPARPPAVALMRLRKLRLCRIVCTVFLFFGL